jgi:exocyst complex component 5
VRSSGSSSLDFLISYHVVAFDPKPFIAEFEAAVDKLIAIRKDVQAKTEQMEKSVRVAEREYSKKMAELNKGFEVCVYG